MVNVPEDIVHEICRYLRVTGVLGLYRARNDEDRVARTTLVSLALVSRACYRAARIALHHTVDVQCYGSEAGLKLLKQCIARPDTAELVRVVFAGSWDNYIDRDMKRCAVRKSVPIADSPALRTAIGSLCVSGTLAEELRSGIVQGWQEAETALLLGLFRRMHKLHMVLEHGLDGSLIMAVAKHMHANRLASQSSNCVQSPSAEAAAPPAQAQPRSYECIRELEVEHWDTEGSTNLEDLVPFLQLPKLETLQGFQLIYETMTKAAVAWSANLLRKLDLQHTVANNRSVEEILRRCPNLQSLSIHWGHEQQADGWGNGEALLTYSGLGSVLRQYGKTLTALRLDPTIPFEHSIHDTRLGSLSPLTSLKLLAVNANAMFVLTDGQSLGMPASSMDSILPPSLERVRVEVSAYTPVRQVKALQRDLRCLPRGGKFPMLRSAHVLRDGNMWHSEKDMRWEHAENDGYWMGGACGDAVPLSYDVREDDGCWRTVFENTDDRRSHPQAQDLSEWFGPFG